MATFTKRPGKKGTRYRAQVRIKRDGKVVHSESRTFSKLATAKSWAKEREAQLEDPAELARVSHDGISIKDLIDRYIREVSALRPFGRSKDAASYPNEGS